MQKTYYTYQTGTFGNPFGVMPVPVAVNIPDPRTQRVYPTSRDHFRASKKRTVNTEMKRRRTRSGR